MAVDIIVPIYNAEEHLENMILSVLGQSYGNFKLFLVIDPSTDLTYEICKNYSDKDDRIVLICNEENKGIGGSRDIGYSVGNSEWITFLDADDMLSPFFLEDMLKAVEDNIDICTCKVRITKTPELEVCGNYKANAFSRAIYSEGEIFKKIYYEGKGEIGEEVLWSKLIRRKLVDCFIDNLRCVKSDIPKMYMDDVLFSVYLWSKSRSTAKVNSELYFYRAWDGSATSRKDFNENDRQSMQAIAYKMNYLRENFLGGIYYRQVLSGCSFIAFYYYRAVNFCKDEERLKKAVECADDYISEFRKDISVRGIHSIKGLIAYLAARIFIQSKEAWLILVGRVLYK